MSKQTSNKFSSEVRSRAVRLVLDQEAEHRSRWTTIMSIAAKIGCTPQTLLDWVAEVDSGKRAGVPTDRAEKLKALERENRELRQANEILRKASDAQLRQAAAIVAEGRKICILAGRGALDATPNWRRSRSGSVPQLPRRNGPLVSSSIGRFSGIRVRRVAGLEMWPREQAVGGGRLLLRNHRRNPRNWN